MTLCFGIRAQITDINALLPLISKLMHSTSYGSEFDERVNNFQNRSVDVDLDNIADGYLPADALVKLIEIIRELVPHTIIVV